MYLARFCYDVLPVNRQRAIEFIHREVEAARANRLNARMLVPLYRSMEFEGFANVMLKQLGLDDIVKAPAAG